jgi:hypothetical protein
MAEGQDSEDRLRQLNLVYFAGEVLGGAASAIRFSQAITAVPIPAAGWLLVAGMGALGLIGKRRQDAFPLLRGGRELEPLGSALRTSARAMAFERSARYPLRQYLRDLIDSFRERTRDADHPRAFAPGRASPLRPCGGAGMLWQATAERGPPSFGAACGRFTRGAVRRDATSNLEYSGLQCVGMGGMPPFRLFVSFSAAEPVRHRPRADFGPTSGRDQQKERVEPSTSLQQVTICTKGVRHA